MTTATQWNHHKIDRFPVNFKLKYVSVFEYEPDLKHNTRELKALKEKCGPKCKVAAYRTQMILSEHHVCYKRLNDPNFLPAKCGVWVSGTGGKTSVAFVDDQWWSIFGILNAAEPQVYYHRYRIGSQQTVRFRPYHKQPPMTQTGLRTLILHAFLTPWSNAPDAAKLRDRAITHHFKQSDRRIEISPDYTES